MKRVNQSKKFLVPLWLLFLSIAFAFLTVLEVLEVTRLWYLFLHFL